MDSSSMAMTGINFLWMLLSSWREVTSWSCCWIHGWLNGDIDGWCYMFLANVFSDFFWFLLILTMLLNFRLIFVQCTWLPWSHSKWCWWFCYDIVTTQSWSFDDDSGSFYVIGLRLVNIHSVTWNMQVVLGQNCLTFIRPDQWK